MTGFDRKNDPLLILALAAGATVASAARQTGVSESTIRRRLRDAEFQKSIDEARGEFMSRAVAKLTGASTQAAETLKSLLRSDMDFCRLAAARTILELGAKLRRDDELVERIEQLEKSMSAEGKEHKWIRTA